MKLSQKNEDWDRIFLNCDFLFAKNLLITTFSGGIYPTELASLLDSYDKNPCRETATGLIQYDYDEFMKFFSQNETIKGMYQSIGWDTTSPRKTTQMLQVEPEFEEYCMSIVDDKHRHKELEAVLLRKGYTEKLLADAWAEFFGDLDSEF